MSLDLGALVGSVVLETASFDRAYTRTMRQMQQLAAESQKTATSTGTLDEAFTGLGASAGTASTEVTRTTRATVASAASQDRAAAAATQHAAAVARVSETMAGLTGSTQREQAATLRAVAAQERYDQVLASGAASTRTLASAQAGLITAQRSVTTAQTAGAASTSRFGGALAGTLKTARDLGIVFGAFEAIKKVVDITKEANDFQRSLVQVQTTADVTAAEVQKASGALLALAGPTAASPRDLAVAWYHAKSVGLDYAKSIDTVRIAAEGARVGNANLEETTNALTSTVASGILGVQSFSTAMGELLAIVGSGDMSLSDLNDALSSGLLTVVKGYGLSLTDVGAALATFGDNNIRGANAATFLRLAVQALAVPAKGGATELGKLGLTSTQLRDDLQKGGLIPALHDLKKHLDDAGIGGKQVGGILTEVFGKRAGPGLQVLISQLDRVDSKFRLLSDAGASFDDKWRATQRTASFALASIGHWAEAAGISLTQKLGPSIATVVTWFSHVLPDALSTVTAIVGGPVRVAWAALSAAIGLVGAVLEPIIHLLDAIKGPLGDIASVALAAYLGFRVFTAIPAILATVSIAVKGAVLNVIDFGTSVATTATTAVAGFTGIGAAATAAADEVDTAGAAAAVGWRGILGPLGLVAAGLVAVISLFRSSDSASHAAADAAKAYTDAFQGGGGRATFLDVITAQLTKADVPNMLAGLTIGVKDAKAALDIGAISGAKFVQAIADGGKPLSDLRAHLENIVRLGNNGVLKDGISIIDASNAVTAAKLLGIINTQITGITDAQTTEIAQLKALGTVATPLTQVADKLNLSSDAVQRYAGILGLAVTKNGDLVNATAANVAAIGQVAHAYNTANQAGAAYLAAVQTFSQSAGTAADRAALIGATLVAANGDALGYAAAMNAAAVADRSFFTDVTSNAKQAKESTREYLGALINLKTGTINYGRAGAGPLIQDLQGIQSAALQAAEATYQHARATETGRRAADDAYRVYETQTRQSLIDQADKLGLTRGEAKRLADTYFGIPKNVKTQIEAAGANPILNVLNRIGQLLATFTGQPWNIDVVTHYRTVGNPPANLGNTGNSGSRRAYTGAAGGRVRGPGTQTSDSVAAWLSNDEHVLSAREVRGLGGHGAVEAMRAAARAGRHAPRLAAGGQATTTAAATTKQGKLVLEITNKDIPGLISALTKTTQQLIAAEQTLTKAAKAAGVGQRALTQIAAAEKNLNALSRRRNQIAGRLGAPTRTPQTAYQALEAARQAYQGERGTVASTISGGFDLATAGRSSGTGVTLASILGDAAQQKQNAELFNQQLRQLQGLGLGRAEFQQLAEKGFAGAESSVLALLGGSRRDIRQLNGSVAGLQAAAGVTGTLAAQDVYGGQLGRARARVTRLTDVEQRIDRRMERIGREISDTLRKALGLPAQPRVDVHVNIDGRQLRAEVRTELRHEARNLQLQAGRT